MAGVRPRCLEGGLQLIQGVGRNDGAAVDLGSKPGLAVNSGSRSGRVELDRAAAGLPALDRFAEIVGRCWRLISAGTSTGMGGGDDDRGSQLFAVGQHHRPLARPSAFIYATAASVRRVALRNDTAFATSRGDAAHAAWANPTSRAGRRRHRRRSCGAP